MTNETIIDESNTAQETTDEPVASNRGERLAKIGTIISAIVASSCCWLPPLLIGLGLLFGFSADRMIGAMRGSLETYRPIFMVVTFGFLGMAFYFTYRPRRMAKGCAENCWPTTGKSVGRRFNMMAMNKVMLWGVAIMAVAFLFFPQQIMGLVIPNTNQTITDDMVQTVLLVEGMTWGTCEAHAEQAIAKAPGVLAVDADFKTNKAVVGTAKGEPVPREKILAALESIQYKGEFVDP